MTALVTKDSLNVMLNNPNPNYVAAVVGRALSALYERQTADEKVSDDTKHWNNIGFAGCDARSGSLTAKYWNRHGRLEAWMVEKWTRVNARTGYPRLCKYDRQLNQIAEEKRANTLEPSEAEWNERERQIEMRLERKAAYRGIE